MTGISDAPPPGGGFLALLAGAPGGLLAGGPGASGILGTTSFAKLLQRGHGLAGRASGTGAVLSLEGDAGGDAEACDVDAALDPAVRHAAQLAPPAQAHSSSRPLERCLPREPVPAGDGMSVPSSAPVEARAAASLEDLLPALVRKVAWDADGQRGIVRLELGAGVLSGANLVIEADGGRIRVTLAAPASVHSSVDLPGWKERIAARLTARGLDVGSVEIA
jgi:hypothetical protein